MAFNLELKHLKVWLCAVCEREELRLASIGQVAFWGDVLTTDPFRGMIRKEKERQ